MRQSLYWDNFNKRAIETADCIKNGKKYQSGEFLVS